MRSLRKLLVSSLTWRCHLEEETELRPDVSITRGGALAADNTYDATRPKTPTRVGDTAEAGSRKEAAVKHSESDASNSQTEESTDSKHSEKLADDHDDDELSQIFRGRRPDPFVAAAPLVVVAACQDGHAIVATHPSDIPLLYDLRTTDETHNSTTASSETIDDGATISSSDETSHTQRLRDSFVDLPEPFVGPWRIESFGRGSTTAVMVSAGWRADCDHLAEQWRSVIVSHLQTVGPSFLQSTLSNEMIASDLSLLMARRAGSETFRALSCASLLLVPPRDGTRTRQQGKRSIWLVDETGAYPVRALALGHAPKAARVNHALGQRDFSQMTAQEGLRVLLHCIRDASTPTTLRQQEQGDDSSSSSSSTQQLARNDETGSDSEQNVQNGDASSANSPSPEKRIRVESATLHPSSGTFRGGLIRHRIAVLDHR